MAGIAERLSGRIGRWRRYRRLLNELRRFSARELHDLGIDPYRLESFARTASRL